MLEPHYQIFKDKLKEVNPDLEKMDYYVQLF